MEDVPQGLPVATAAEFTVAIEDSAGLLAGLDDEPVRPRILRMQDELMRLVADAKLACVAP